MSSSKAVIHKTIMEVEKASKGVEEKKDNKFKKIDRNYIIPQKYKIYVNDYLNILISTHGG